MKAIGHLAIAILLLTAFAPASAEPVNAPSDSLLKFGISARTIAGINRADAFASLKVWITSLAAYHNLPTETDPRIFDRTEDFAAALQRGEIDVLTAPADEFFMLEQAVPMAALYAQIAGGNVGEVYVLLVREESPHHTLEDLRGSRLSILTHQSASLGTLWLEVELARANLPAPSGFFRETISSDKINRAILPVFFKQADACLITHRAFAVAGELNPQVTRQLRVIAYSPPLISHITSHRMAMSETVSRLFREAALSLADTPGGQQVLRLFQHDSFVEISEKDLAPTRALIEAHRRSASGLRGKAASP